MTTMNRALLQVQTPFILARRFRGKINIQKPKKPHFERQLLIDLTKPWYAPPKNSLPDIALCDRGEKRKAVEIDNPFERILARECLNWFNTSKMVIFLHTNSISMEDKMPIFAALKKNDMHLRTYGKKIVSMATKGTRYEAVNHLFTSHQEMIFGQPTSVAKMFKLMKKTPQLVIMESDPGDVTMATSGKKKLIDPDVNDGKSGIIQDTLMSKNELVEFSKLPNLDVARSQLCSVLQSAGSCLVGQLNQSQQMLVSNLERHVEIQKKTDGPAAESKEQS